MPLSQFDNVKFLTAGGKIAVSGPFTLSEVEQDMRVVDVHFVLIQNKNVVDGEGSADGTDWDGTTTGVAGNFEAGKPVLGVGWALLTRSGAKGGYQMFNWSDAVTLEPAD
jgi:hypothetical protein